MKLGTNIMPMKDTQPPHILIYKNQQYDDRCVNFLGRSATSSPFVLVLCSWEGQGLIFCYFVECSIVYYHVFFMFF